MDIQNHYYGHSGALALHAGLRSVRHISGLLQHGWTVRSPSLTQFSDFASLPAEARRLVWTHGSRGWDAASDPFESTPIGAPFLYLSALTATAGVAPLGTVVFPVHHTRIVKISRFDDEFAQQVLEREGPAVICLHPEDLADPEKLRSWTRHGHSIVSAGSRRDSWFLGRILRLVRGARRVVSNQLSTAVLYAAAERTATSIYGPDAHNGAVGTEVAERTRELWPEFYDDAAAGDRHRIALAELGSAYLLEPQKLRETLGWDRRSAMPFLSYWGGAPIRKAGAVLGLIERPAGAQDPGAGVSPLAFLRHPQSHLPGPLPRLRRVERRLPEPLRPSARG